MGWPLSPRKVEVRAEFPLSWVKLGVEEGAALGDQQGSRSARMGVGLWSLAPKTQPPTAGGVQGGSFPCSAVTKQWPPGGQCRAVRTADRVACGVDASHPSTATGTRLGTEGGLNNGQHLPKKALRQRNGGDAPGFLSRGLEGYKMNEERDWGVGAGGG